MDIVCRLKPRARARELIQGRGARSWQSDVKWRPRWRRAGCKGGRHSGRRRARWRCACRSPGLWFEQRRRWRQWSGVARQYSKWAVARRGLVWRGGVDWKMDCLCGAVARTHRNGEHTAVLVENGHESSRQWCTRQQDQQHQKAGDPTPAGAYGGRFPHAWGDV